MPKSEPSGMYTIALPASSNPGTGTAAPKTQQIIPMIITSTEPYQGTGESSLRSGECPTLSPHLGQAVKWSGNLTWQ